MEITWTEANPEATKKISVINVGKEAYNLKDAAARTQIESLDTRIKNLNSTVLRFKGVTDTAISDGSTTNTIQINNQSYDAKNGDVVIYKPKESGLIADTEREYVWVGTDATPSVGKWQEFGSTGALKAFAFADKGTVAIPDAGEVTLDTPTSLSGSGITITPTITQKTGKEVKLTQAKNGAGAVRGITSAGTAATLKSDGTDVEDVISTATVTGETLTITAAKFTPNKIPTMDETNDLATTTVAQQPEYENSKTYLTASYTRSTKTSNYEVNPSNATPTP